jgi:membrane protein CcdC involved in cytochrome C biogenesis
VRLVLRAYVERFVTPVQTGGIFFILAFGMVARWRVAMLRSYLRLRRAPAGDVSALTGPAA